MKKLHPVNGLLVHYAAPATGTRGMAPKTPKQMKAGDLHFTLQPYQHLQPASLPGTRGMAAPGTTVLAKAALAAHSGSTHPWDLAHHALENGKGLQFVEPDIIHVNEAADEVALGRHITRGFASREASSPYDTEWPHPGGAKGNIWHLEKDFSQLKMAREAVAGLPDTVRIAHLDTGYLKDHQMLPLHIRAELQKNFGHDDDTADDASDRENPIINGIGHGTSTMILLAGRDINYPDYGFRDFLGGAPWAEIVPVRVSRSVVLLATSSFTDAMDYIISLSANPATRCDIVTMSMGGLPTKAWATVVNAAYENGILLCAASGDNTGGLPTRRTVYPARFQRVVNVTGVCYDNSPYYHGNIFHTRAVQGNFGPEFLMGNAIAAFSPNVPWIKHGDGNEVAMDQIGLGGAGTSSSTPQVAAAAANYLRKNYSALQALEPWQRVEAIRKALFSTANKDRCTEKVKLYYGNGILQAFDALSVPVKASGLKKQAPDEVSFPLFHLLFRGMQPAGAPPADPFQQMIETEMLQLVNSDPFYQDILEPVKYDFPSLTAANRKKIIDTLIQQPNSSHTLKKYLKAQYKKITRK